MKIKTFPRATLSLLLLTILLTVILPPVYAEEEHVYYGYVPVGTDAGDPNMYPQRRNIEELINGVIYNYTPPEGTAILDIIATEDNTYVEVWDILAKERIGSATLNALEKYTLFVKFGTFFKVVANKRVSVLQSGGYLEYEVCGDTTFYPADDFGFIGKRFTFTPTSFPNAYITYRYGSNFICAALEDTEVILYDSTGEEVMRFSLRQGESLAYNRGRLINRRDKGSPTHGGGSSIIFRAVSTGLISVRSATQRSFLAVPAVTGGWVGKLFFTPILLAVDEPGAEQVLIIVPIEPGTVSIYDGKMNLLAEKSFTQDDINNKVFWFYSFGKPSQTAAIIKSTCKITVLEGSTYIPPEIEERTIEPEDLGSNIAYMGARANEETRFYTPSTAIIFAPEDLTITVNGETKSLKKDDFIILDRGVHSIKASHEVIIQINCPGNPLTIQIWGVEGPGGWTRVIETKTTGWTDWASYLISVQDIRKTIEVPKGFAEAPAAGMGINWAIIGAVMVGAIAAGGGFLLLRRRRLAKVNKT
ncbi:MAG: hypothetical protein N3E47_05395 [Candidatus Bathyarchaeota archaeon]|nr:hypothetical protein [Candidatus Bathyarchaeota archaeon]